MHNATSASAVLAPPTVVRAPTRDVRQPRVPSALARSRFHSFIFSYSAVRTPDPSYLLLFLSGDWGRKTCWWWDGGGGGEEGVRGGGWPSSSSKSSIRRLSSGPLHAALTPCCSHRPERPPPPEPPPTSSSLPLSAPTWRGLGPFHSFPHRTSLPLRTHLPLLRLNLLNLFTSLALLTSSFSSFTSLSMPPSAQPTFKHLSSRHSRSSSLSRRHATAKSDTRGSASGVTASSHSQPRLWQLSFKCNGAVGASSAPLVGMD
mmetsp:Transcript_49666/g.106120  ORF Transcript_49666/g.106120 Transcript_49666/m.106120 type:complete len:260 (-) Transcript_49666:187-966(-)